MAEALYVIMRWLHIASAVTLVGGLIFGRLVMAPSVAALAPEAGEKVWQRAAGAFRPMVVAAICALVVSGIYNILSNPGHSPRYHMLLGIKLLLALHVFAVSILITRPVNPRRVRMMTGGVISGLVIIAIAAWLRRIF